MSEPKSTEQCVREALEESNHLMGQAIGIFVNSGRMKKVREFEERMEMNRTLLKNLSKLKP